MSKTIKIKKGLDIKLKGKAEQSVVADHDVTLFGILPSDFPGLIPKLTVKTDDTVKAGTPLFHDKYQPEVTITSPVSGKIVAVNRGERRRILDIAIESDGKFESETFEPGDIKSLSRETIRQTLLQSGLWAYIVQRPFGVIAKASDTPRDIFISGFDSSPLAPDTNFTLAGELKNFQCGIDVLSKMTDGKVYLGLKKDSILSQITGAEINYFEGPHPSGNAGIQMHHIKPLNKGEIVWTLDPQSVVFIGRLFTSGKVNLEKIIAFAGSEVKNPCYIKTHSGASVKQLADGKTYKNKTERTISGNVLTGSNTHNNGFLGFYHNQVTVIPEGNEIEPFGWITPGLNKFSASATFFSKLFSKKEYTLNANFHGGERAFVMSDQYGKVLPMDVLPVYLIKAIMDNDIDKMEQLGIYEVIEEDLALCEYVCTSKIEVQDVLRKGITSMIKELG